MLARLQQITTLGLLAVALAWAAYFIAADRPVFAIAGAGLILLGYALVLGLEFVLLRHAHGDDPAPRASPAQLLRAWAGEVISAPRVFCWRQPFRSNAEPDFLPADARGKRGVLLVHGFVCNRGLWNPWLRAFREAGVPAVAINLEPVFGSIDQYADVVEAGIRRLEAATGMAPVVAAHSMGGLAVRAWMAAGHSRDARVHHVVTIGTPHRGTWLARFAATLNASQMRQLGPWITALGEREPPSRYARFTCFYSHCDNIVFPPSTATLRGADNRHLDGVAHVHMVFHPAVWSEVRRRVSASAPERAAERMEP